MFPHHHLLDREGGDDIERHARIVSFAMAWSALDQRIVPGHAGLLRSLRDVVDIGPERDDGFALAPRRDPGRRDAGDAALDLEAFGFEGADEIFRRLEFL